MPYTEIPEDERVNLNDMKDINVKAADEVAVSKIFRSRDDAVLWRPAIYMTAFKPSLNHVYDFDHLANDKME